jgi:hypothetical protein
MLAFIIPIPCQYILFFALISRENIFLLMKDSI